MFYYMFGLTNSMDFFIFHPLLVFFYTCVIAAFAECAAPRSTDNFFLQVVLTKIKKCSPQDQADPGSLCRCYGEKLWLLPGTRPLLWTNYNYMIRRWIKSNSSFGLFGCLRRRYLSTMTVVADPITTSAHTVGVNSPPGDHCLCQHVLRRNDKEI